MWSKPRGSGQFLTKCNSSHFYKLQEIATRMLFRAPYTYTDTVTMNAPAVNEDLAL